MKLTAAMFASLCLMGSALAEGGPTTTQGSKPMLTSEHLRAVAPALEKYRQDTLLGDLWNRPGLTPRERSIGTVPALIAPTQTTDIPA